ncbi:hypothetical protein [Bordetella genomosp. 1]|nr:hypothetical protein [Bordetella genomosp. 1]
MSLDPEGTRWLFVECAEEQRRPCEVMRYDLDSSRLYRYALPAGYRYDVATYSPTGNFILVSRQPLADGSTAALRAGAAASEILVMHADGSGLQVLPLRPGIKLAAFMSRDESQVAYWRANRMHPENHRIPFSDMEIWEYRCGARSDERFAPKAIGMFGGGPIQYLSGQEILFHTYGGSPRFEDANFEKKYASSEIYRIRRDEVGALVPVVIAGFITTTLPSVDKSGNLYAWGALATNRNLGLIRTTPDGSSTIWHLSAQPSEMIVSASGDDVAIVYLDRQEKRGSAETTGLARFSPSSSVMHPVSIPPLKSATEIPVVPGAAWCLQ